MRARVLATVATLAFVAAPLAAQQMSITPYIGTLTPLRSMVIDTSGGGYFKLTRFTMAGMRLSKQMSPALALQLQLGVGNGGLEIVSGGTPLSLEATVYTVDARASLRLMGNDDANLRGIVGAGWSQFGTGLFEAAHEIDDGTKLKGTATGIVGLGFRTKFVGGAALTSDLTDRIHAQPIEASGLSGLVEQMQHDIAFNVGLSFPLGS